LDYSFYVQNDRVRIIERKRGSPIDRLVSELMILVNATWGKLLAEQSLPAIYRSQSSGKVKMSTVPSDHQGLGVAQYAWASSPIRRYVDLLNQRQLVAWLRGRPAPYARSDELLVAMRDFELAYDAYAEFQRNMERYWCLRWLQQEGVRVTQAQVFKEDVVKVGNIPLLTRLPSLPSLPAGSVIEVEVSAIDLLTLTFHAELRGKH
jgi:exoribonuclease-2